MLEYGLEWHALDTYFQFKEIAAPATPQQNHIRQYATDSGGISTMCWKNDAGNVTCLSTGGGTIPTGSGGVSGAVAFWTSATTLGADDTHFHWDDTNDQLLIGINSGSHFGTDSGLVVDEDASSSIIGSVAHSATVGHSGSLNLGRSRGTHASPSIVQSGDRVSRVVSQAWDGTALRDAAAIDAIVNGTPGSNDMPGALQFLTTPDGSITLAIRATLDQKGDLGLGTVTPNYAGFTRAMTIESGTNVALELASSRADADAAGLGFIDARYLTNSANHNRVAAIQFSSSGTTVNQRGGMIQLLTKADASTTLSERFRVGPSGQWGIGGATFGGSGDIFSSGGASAAPTWVTRATLNAALDHGTLAGLGDDDHTQYALLAGRSGGQSLTGGTASGNDLTLLSTSNATKGNIFFGTLSTYDQVNDRWGFGDLTPDQQVNITADGSAATRGLYVTGFGANTGGAVITGRKTRGANGLAHTAVSSGDILGNYAFQGSDGSAYQTGASIRPVTTETWSGSARGTEIQFRNVANTTTTLTTRWTINNGGELFAASTASFIDLTGVTTKVLKVPTDNTDPTGGGGAATGRIPIHDAAGNLRYIPYY